MAHRVRTNPIGADQAYAETNPIAVRRVLSVKSCIHGLCVAVNRSWRRPRGEKRTHIGDGSKPVARPVEANCSIEANHSTDRSQSLDGSKPIARRIEANRSTDRSQTPVHRRDAARYDRPTVDGLGTSGVDDGTNRRRIGAGPGRSTCPALADVPVRLQVAAVSGRSSRDRVIGRTHGGLRGARAWSGGSPGTRRARRSGATRRSSRSTS